jgi:N-acetylglucosamine kinase-like BadF-type ATPase
MAAPFIVGIDGGGTRSQAIALSAEGELLGEVSGGPLNYNTTSPDEFRASLSDILQQFTEGHGLAPAAEHTVIGTASLFTSLSDVEAAKLCGELLPTERLTVVGDVVTALYGATLGAPGLLVVSGTGSIAAAMDDEGQCHTTGGLGPAIGGDPGSAHWIASEVLLHASVESCNGTESTGLTDLVCRYFSIPEFQQLVPAIYSEVEPAKRLAGLSHFIAASELKGQPFWLSILRRAGVRLAKLCEPLLTQLDLAKWPGTVHVSGSVLANNEQVRESFVAELSAKAKRALAVESPALSAVEGAALMALKKIAPTKVAEVAARLAKGKS